MACVRRYNEPVYIMCTERCTVAPRYDEPRFNEDPVITNNI